MNASTATSSSSKATSSRRSASVSAERRTAARQACWRAARRLKLKTRPPPYGRRLRRPAGDTVEVAHDLVVRFGEHVVDRVEVGPDRDRARRRRRPSRTTVCGRSKLTWALMRDQQVLDDRAAKDRPPRRSSPASTSRPPTGRHGRRGSGRRTRRRTVAIRAPSVKRPAAASSMTRRVTRAYMAGKYPPASVEPSAAARMASNVASSTAARYVVRRALVPGPDQVARSASDARSSQPQSRRDRSARRAAESASPSLRGCRPRVSTARARGRARARRGRATSRCRSSRCRRAPPRRRSRRRSARGRPRQGRTDVNACQPPVVATLVGTVGTVDAGGTAVVESTGVGGDRRGRAPQRRARRGSPAGRAPDRTE